MNINLTANEEIPEYSAIPPHTSTIALSVEDFLSLLFNAVTPLMYLKITYSTMLLRISN